MAAPSAAVDHPHKAHSIGFNLSAIAMVVALAGLAVAYGLDSVSRTHREQQTAEAASVVVRTVAGRELHIPRALLRYDEPASAPGFTDEVNLRLMLPLGLDGAERPIDLTLIPRSKARPSASLLDGVYLHQFTLDEVPGPPGLIGKPLAGTDGYAGETVWYDPLSPDPFVTKCQAPVDGTGPARCLRTVFFDTVAGIYAFDADALGAWRNFDSEAEAVLAGIGVRHTR